MRILTLYALLALHFGIAIPKRGGSSGTGSRGGGGGLSSGGARPAPAGGTWGSGGARPPAGGGWSGGRPMGGTGGTFAGTGGGKSGFLSSPTSRGIAAGLVGGALAGAGTALLVSHLASSGRYQGPNGNYYYYGHQNYPSQTPHGKIKCVYEIPANDTTQLNNIYVDNTTKVKEIVFECNLGYERCCNGLECCKLENQQVYVNRQEKSGISWWGGLLIGLLLVSVFGCIGYCIYTRVKKADSATGPDATYVTESDPNMYPPQQQYPNQPQPFAHPQPYQSGYPNQSAAYGSYPAQPAPTYPSQQPPGYPGYPAHSTYPQQPYGQKY